jgi:hypothetical protein
MMLFCSPWATASGIKIDQPVFAVRELHLRQMCSELM